MNLPKLKVVIFLFLAAWLVQPAYANEGFKKLCMIGRMANKDGASGKQEISAGLQQSMGWSKGKADATTNLIVKENCPGVW
jgi:hypothetical protein